MEEFVEVWRRLIVLFSQFKGRSERVIYLLMIIIMLISFHWDPIQQYISSLWGVSKCETTDWTRPESGAL